MLLLIICMDDVISYLIFYFCFTERQQCGKYRKLISVIMNRTRITESGGVGNTSLLTFAVDRSGTFQTLVIRSTAYMY